MSSPQEFEQLSSLPQVLCHWAQALPHKVALRFLADGTTIERSLTYGELDRRARVLAGRLAADLSPGDRAILLYPAGLDFLEGFFGCLYAGVIPIPAPAPDSVQFKRAWPRLESIIGDAAVSLILTDSGLMPTLRENLQRTALADTGTLATDGVASPQTSDHDTAAVAADDLAYLQYTSGSIAAPKGVMISHGNLIAHLRSLKTALGYGQDDVSLNWMPHHHDYGLVQGLLLPLFAGGSCYIMSPTSFIRKPVRWLEAISRFRVTHSQGSNFSYAYCMRKYDAATAPELDLSRWRVASIGAEPINPDVLRAFERTFLPAGFKPTSLIPAYGLAEATLVVTTRRPGDGVRYGHFEARALMKHRVAETENQVQRTIIGCGAPVSEDTRVCIVDPETRRPCLANEIGEVWVSSPGMAQGYWNRPEESGYTFRARLAGSDEAHYLRTGDLGFLKGGELFLAGRHKDLIIIRGQNHRPEDIEFAAEASHPQLRVGRCAAFSVEAVMSEQLVVVAEWVGRGDDTLYRAAVDVINEAVTRVAELTPQAVVLIRSGSLPVTSSGKIQRQACRKLFIDGGLNPVYTQVLDLAEASMEQTEAGPDRPSRDALIDRICAAPDRADVEDMRAYLLSVLSEIMQTGCLERIDPNHDLSTLGIDSVASVEIRACIEDELALPLPINLLHLYSTLGSLGEFILNRLRSTQPVEPELEGGSRQSEAISTETHRAPDDSAEKQRLLDWRVLESDRAFDLPGEVLQSWERLSMPPGKVQMRRHGPQIITDDWKPSEPFIRKDSKVLGMGSCFTRDIVLWLAECGFNRQFPESPYNALLRYPAIGNNAYLAEQFRILETQAQTQPADTAQVDKNSRFVDAEQDDGRQLFELLAEMDVLLLTLGGVETWRDNLSDTVLKAPLVLAEYSPERHSFKVESHAQTLQHLEAIDRIAQRYFPRLKIILTMPLGRMATYRPMSALSAACAQEATLRSAIGEFLDTRANDRSGRIHYFPGYELVSQFYVDPFQVDNIHVTPHVTGKLCSSFAEMFCLDAPEMPAADSLADHDLFHSQAMAASLENSGGDVGNQEMQSKIANLEAESFSLQEVCRERQAVIEKLDQALRERPRVQQRLSLVQRVGTWLRGKG